MKDKQYFTQSEIITDIKETLDNYAGYYCDLHNETFNTDYYIIGTKLAKEALEQYGVFDAIEKIQDYEKDNYGEILTDFSNPEKVANMLYYILGEKFLYETFDFNSKLDEIASELEIYGDLWNSQSIDEVNEALIEALKEFE